VEHCALKVFCEITILSCAVRAKDVLLVSGIVNLPRLIPSLGNRVVFQMWAYEFLFY